MFSLECVDESSPPSNSDSRVILNADRLVVDYQLKLQYQAIRLTFKRCWARSQGAAYQTHDDGPTLKANFARASEKPGKG